MLRLADLVRIGRIRPEDLPAGASPAGTAELRRTQDQVVAPPRTGAATEASTGRWPAASSAAGELADLIAGRPSATPADPFEGSFGGTPSFEALLRGV